MSMEAWMLAVEASRKYGESFAVVALPNDAESAPLLFSLCGLSKVIARTADPRLEVSV